MAQQIGLEAVLGMSDFNSGMSKYMDGISQMESKTSSFATNVGAHFQSFGGAVLKTTAIVGGALVAAAGGAGLAIGKFTVDGIKAAADLESRMSGIAAVLNMTTEEAKPLKDLIMSLAINPNLKVNTEGAADAIENLAKNGASAKDIINGLAEATILLSNATGAEAGPAADVLTDVMAQFNLKAEDATRIINGVVGVTNASKMTFDDYRLAIAQAGGVAGAFGVTMEEFNASIAATASNFASGSDAGTSFKSFLNNLIPTTKEQKKAFRELGLSFYDNNGQMKDLSVITEELNEKLFQEVTFTRQVSNMTAEDAAQKKMLEKAIAKTNMELYKYSVGLNGVAQSEADKAVSIDRLNREHDAAVTAYGKLAGAVGTTTTATRKLTDEERNRFLDLAFGADGMRTVIGLAESGAVVYTDAALAAKELGISQDEVNKYIEGGITGYETYLLTIGKTDAMEQAKTRTDNLKASFEILTDTIAAIQLAIGDKFLPILRQLVEWATTWVNTNSPAIIAAFSLFADNLGTVINYVSAFIASGDIMNAQFAMMSPVMQSVTLSTMAWVGWIQQSIAATQAFLQPVTDMVAAFVSWQDVLVVVGLAVASVVIPAIWGLIAAMAPVIATIGAAILVVAALRNAWEYDFLGIQTATLSAISYMTAALTPFTSALSAHLGGALTEVKTWATGNETEFTHVKAIWEGAKTSAQTMFDDLKNLVVTNLPIWTATLTEWGIAATQWLLNAASEVNFYVQTYVKTLVETVSNELPTWKAQLTEWADTALLWISEASEQVGEYIRRYVSALTETVSSELPEWQNSLLQWGKAAIQWLIDAIVLIAPAISRWASALISEIAAKLPDLIVQMLKWATALVSWITSGEANAIPHLGTWLGKVLGWVTIAAVAITAAVIKFSVAFLSWVADVMVKIAPELANLSAAILTGIAKIAAAIVVAVRNLAVEWWNTISTAVDWNALGQNVMSAIKSGMESIAVALVASIVSQVATVQAKWTSVNWEDLGQDVVASIRDGVASMQNALVSKFTEIVDAAKNIVKNAISAFKQLGKDIIQGVIDGIWSMKDELIKRAEELFDLLPDWIKKLYKSESPSKVFMEIGQDVVAGFMIGLEDMKDVKSVFQGLMNSFKSFKKVANSDQYGAMIAQLDTTNEFLDAQVDLLDQLEKSGLDPKSILGDIKLGISADPKKLMASITGLLQSAQQQIGQGLFRRQMGLIAQSVIKPFVALITDQTSRLNEMLSDTINEFGQIRIDRLMKQINSLDTQIKEYTESGTPLDKAGQNKLANLISQREQLIQQISSVAQVEKMLGIAEGKDNLSLMEKQIAILKQAKDLGVNIAPGAFGDMADDNTLRALTMTVSGIQRAQSAQLRSQIDLLRQGDNPQLRRLTTLEKQQASLDEQVALMKQLSELGVTFAGTFGLTASEDTLQRAKLAIAEAKLQKTILEMNQLGGKGTPEDKKRADREKQLKALDDQNALLDQQLSLIGEMNDLKIAIPTKPKWGSSITLDEIQSMMVYVAQAKVQKSLIEIAERRTRDVIDRVLKPYLSWIGTQTTQMNDILSQTLSDFGKIRADKLVQKISDLDKQIAAYTGSKTALDANAQNALRNLVTQRATLIAQLGGIAMSEKYMGIDSERNRIGLLTKQVDLLKQAKELGVYIPDSAYGDVMSDYTMRDLQAVFANIQYMQSWQLKQQLELLRHPKVDWQANRLNVLKEQQKSLDDQLTLLQKMQALGLQTSGEYTFGIDMTPGEMANMSIRAAEEELRRTRNEIDIANHLTPEQLNVQATQSVSQMYKAQVLDPILKTLRESVMLEGDRLALYDKYKKGVEEVNKMEMKQRQLDFLMMQLDLQERLDKAFPKAIELQIMAGIQWGVGAKLDDLIAFVGRFIDALKNKVVDDLQIHSPSRVFMKYGRQVMQGLTLGMANMSDRPLRAMQSALRPLPHAFAADGGRMLSMNMGGVTINNGMDDVMFEARVRQVVENLL